jgi:hypothetical protein
MFKTGRLALFPAIRKLGLGPSFPWVSFLLGFVSAPLFAQSFVAPKFGWTECLVIHRSFSSVPGNKFVI